MEVTAGGRAWVAGATVRGAAHVRSGMPNQDTVAWLPSSANGTRVVMAVSDGHGAAASPRSDVGSRIAADVAVRTLWTVGEPLTESLLTEATNAIVDDWRAAVAEHLAREPFSEAELARLTERCGQETAALVTGRPLVAYGATLLYALVGPERIGLAQLGDGDVLLVDTEGRVHRPLPADERLVAHATTSLCDDDPILHTRIAVVPTESALVMLATDGYPNSFADDSAFLRVGSDLLRTVDQLGVGALRRSLPDWLTETTQRGAGDDIAVAIAVTAAWRGDPREATGAGRRPATRPVRQRLAAAPPPAHPAAPLPPPAPLPAPALPPPAPLPAPVRPTRAWPAMSPIPLVVLLLAIGALLGGFALWSATRHSSVPAASHPRDQPAGADRRSGSVFQTTTEPRRRPGVNEPSAGREPTASEPTTAPPPTWSNRPDLGGWAQDGTVATRAAGGIAETLELSGSIVSSCRVDGGLLVLVAGGRFGRLDDAATLEQVARAVTGWDTEPDAAAFECGGTGWYLVGPDGSRLWTINPLTGKLGPLVQFEP